MTADHAPVSGHDLTRFQGIGPRAAHDLLADLARGLPLGKAVTKAVRHGGRRAPSEHELFRWRQRAMTLPADIPAVFALLAR